MVALDNLRSLFQPKRFCVSTTSYSEGWGFFWRFLCTWRDAGSRVQGAWLESACRGDHQGLGTAGEAWMASGWTRRCALQHACVVGRGWQGAALLMSETAALYLCQQPASPSSSSLPLLAAPLRGRGVQATYVTRGSFIEGGVWRRQGVCLKGKTLSLEEGLELGAWLGSAWLFACPTTAVWARERFGGRAEDDKVARGDGLAFAVAPHGQKLASFSCGCQWWLGLPQVASQFTLYIL